MCRQTDGTINRNVRASIKTLNILSRHPSGVNRIYPIKRYGRRSRDRNVCDDAEEETPSRRSVRTYIGPWPHNVVPINSSSTISPCASLVIQINSTRTRLSVIASRSIHSRTLGFRRFVRIVIGRTDRTCLRKSLHHTEWLKGFSSEIRVYFKNRHIQAGSGWNGPVLMRRVAEQGWNHKILYDYIYVDVPTNRNHIRHSNRNHNNSWKPIFGENIVDVETRNRNRNNKIKSMFGQNTSSWWRYRYVESANPRLRRSALDLPSRCSELVV